MCVSILVITASSSIEVMIFRVALRFGKRATSMPNATLAHDRNAYRLRPPLAFEPLDSRSLVSYL